MNKTTPFLALVAVVAMAPSIALAELSANIALTSKYKYRGQDQSDPAKSMLPAVQGGFDYSSGGFYVGNWNSSIGGFADGTEMDFYGGYSGEAGSISYDVGLLYYYYPGSDNSDLNTAELYGSIGFGPITAKYSQTVSSKYFGFGGKAGYLELNGEMEVASGITLSAHIGTTRFSSGAEADGAVNYQDYKIAAGFDLGNGFAAETAIVGATKKDDWGDVNKTRFVVTLSKSL